MNRVKILTGFVAICLTLCAVTDMYAAAQTDTLSGGTSMTQEDINMVMSVFDGQQPYEIIGKADGFIKTGKSDEGIAQIA